MQKANLTKNEYSESYQSRVGRYEQLVDELMKEVPSEAKVEKLMKELDLPYSSEPIDRLNVVLKALHS